MGKVKPTMPKLTVRGGCRDCTDIKCQYKANSCQTDSEPAEVTNKFGCNTSWRDYVQNISTAGQVRRVLVEPHQDKTVMG